MDTQDILLGDLYWSIISWINKWPNYASSIRICVLNGERLKVFINTSVIFFSFQ